MSVREMLNKNPAIASGAVLVVIAVAVFFIFRSTMGGPKPKAPTEAYFSVDDGASYFASDTKELAPFEHEGKTAVKAYVYKCADGKPFVGYLERYTPDAKKTLMAARAASDKAAGQGGPQSGPPINVQSMAMAAQTGIEVKRPKDKNWVKMMDYGNAMKVKQVTCPDGNPDSLEPVLP